MRTVTRYDLSDALAMLPAPAAAVLLVSVLPELPELPPVPPIDELPELPWRGSTSIKVTTLLGVPLVVMVGPAMAWLLDVADVSAVPGMPGVPGAALLAVPDESRVAVLAAMPALLSAPVPLLVLVLAPLLVPALGLPVLPDGDGLPVPL